MNIHSLVRTLALVLILPAGPAALEAQTPDRDAWYDGHVSVMAGVSVFDRDDVAATGVYALRADMPVYPNLLVEGGLAYAHPARPGGVKDIFIPGVQVQLRGWSGQFSPYVGLGAGLTIEVPEAEGSTDTSFSPSFATGVRIAVSEGTGLRFEGRLNAVGADFQGIYSEFTAGLTVSW